MTLTVGSLFSGIGGIELGLKRAGMRTLWQVENNAFCQAVLEEHWPEVERFEDVRSVGGHNLRRVDVICGGFPCQDLSYAGKGAGIKEGTRSGLWFEFARIVRELRPRYVLVENVPALRSRGLHIVLGDLAACGYDAEWDCIPAAAVGAPHRRDRIWIVAYRQDDAPRPDADDRGPHRASSDQAGQEREVQPGDEQGCLSRSLGMVMAYPDEQRPAGRGLSEWQREHRVSDVGGRGGRGPDSDGQGDSRSRVGTGNRSATLGVSDADRAGSPERGQRPSAPQEGAGGRDGRGRGLAWEESVRGAGEDPSDVADADLDPRHERRSGDASESPRGRDADRSAVGADVADSDEIGRHWRSGVFGARWWPELGDGSGWLSEPNVGRVAHGVPNRVDRLTALGNAVVPQVVEWIGRRIVEAEEARMNILPTDDQAVGVRA